MTDILAIQSFSTVAAMNAVTTSPPGALAYVYDNNGSPSDPANGFYQWSGSAWVGAAWLMTQVAVAAGTVVLGNNRFFGGGNEELTGTLNTGIGAQTLQSITTGADNATLGFAALRANTSGSQNVAIGSSSERANQSGTGNITIGAGAGVARTAGDDNVTLGRSAMSNVTMGGEGNIAIGTAALTNYPGDDAVAIGRNALVNVTGIRSVAIGGQAGSGITSGDGNIFVGYGAGASGSQAPGVNYGVVIGYGAYSTTSNQIVLGADWTQEFRVFGMSFARCNLAAENVFLGGAGNASITGTTNTAVGAYAMHSATSAGACTALGRNALYWAEAPGNCVAIGYGAIQNARNPNPGALPPGTTLGDPTDCTAIGAEAGRDWQGIVGATAIGRYSQGNTTTGSNNTSVGDASLRDNVTGQQNVAVGYGAMAFNVSGNYNVGLGQAAFYHATAASENACLGHSAFEFTTGSGNCGLGYCAGRTLTAGDNNVFVGRNAGNDPAQEAEAENCIAIGASTFTIKSNQIVIGNSAHNETVLRGIISHTVYTVADLPDAVEVGPGARSFVTDAGSLVFYDVLTDGGNNMVPVFSDGRNWRVG